MILKRDTQERVVCYGFALILGAVTLCAQIQGMNFARAAQGSVADKLQAYLREGRLTELNQELAHLTDLASIQEETGCADLVGQPVCYQGVLLGQSEKKSSELIPELRKRLKNHGWMLLKSKNPHELMAKKEQGRYRSCLIEIDDSGKETQLLMQLLEKGVS